MKSFTFLKGAVCLFVLSLVSSTTIFAQDLSASRDAILRPQAGNTVTITLTRSNGDWNGSGNYTWSVNNTTGISSPASWPFAQGTGGGNATVNVTFTAAALGNYTFTVTRGNDSESVTVNVGNIAAAVSPSNSDFSRGQSIGVLQATTGVYNAGPTDIFDAFTNDDRTSALAVSLSGHYYYIRNVNNSGSVTVTGANPTGSTISTIGTIDLNGASSNELGFVRLAIDAAGIGWILAGDGTTIYLAKFTANNLVASAITIVNSNVPFAPNSGDASDFTNGDLAFTANGTMYILANDGAVTPTSTSIFTMNPNAVTPTLARKFFVLDNLSAPFVGTVNGTAFDFAGNLYISTATGVYFINQNSVNLGNGTVNATLVRVVSGITDLASNVWPQQSTLPVTMLSFSGSLRNDVTSVNWESENEVNFSHYEVERSTNGSSFSTVGSKPSAGSTGRSTYQFSDNLASVSGNVFYYRLKIVDLNGKFSYSKVIMVRKDQRNLTGITLNPNPVVNAVATVRFNSGKNATVSLRVIDAAGKVVLQQQERAFEGINSVSVNNLDRLQAGNYILQLSNENELNTIKFTVVR